MRKGQSVACTASLEWAISSNISDDNFAYAIYYIDSAMDRIAANPTDSALLEHETSHCCLVNPDAICSVSVECRVCASKITTLHVPRIMNSGSSLFHTTTPSKCILSEYVMYYAVQCTRQHNNKYLISGRAVSPLLFSHSRCHFLLNFFINRTKNKWNICDDFTSALRCSFSVG